MQKTVIPKVEIEDFQGKGAGLRDDIEKIFIALKVCWINDMFFYTYDGLTQKKDENQMIDLVLKILANNILIPKEIKGKADIPKIKINEIKDIIKQQGAVYSQYQYLDYYKQLEDGRRTPELEIKNIFTDGVRVCLTNQFYTRKQIEEDEEKREWMFNYYQLPISYSEYVAFKEKPQEMKKDYRELKAFIDRVFRFVSEEGRFHLNQYFASLTTDNTKGHLYYFQDKGGGGKGIVEQLTRILASVGNLSLKSEQDSFGLDGAEGASVLLLSEADGKELTVNRKAKVLKDLTGQGTLRVNPKFGKKFNQWFNVHILMFTNYEIELTEEGNSVERRLYIISLTKYDRSKGMRLDDTEDKMFNKVNTKKNIIFRALSLCEEVFKGEPYEISRDERAEEEEEIKIKRYFYPPQTQAIEEIKRESNKVRRTFKKEGIKAGKNKVSIKTLHTYYNRLQTVKKDRLSRKDFEPKFYAFCEEEQIEYKKQYGFDYCFINQQYTGIYVNAFNREKDDTEEYTGDNNLPF